MDTLKEIVKRAAAAAKEANLILATQESSATRVIVLEDSYVSLGKLSLKQDDLFRQALRATEHGLFRSAIVMAWAGFMDFIEEKLGEDKFVALNREFPDWKISTVEDLRDLGSDFQILGATRKVGICSKIEEKALKGLLNRRNEAAHPSDYYPGLNEALGYISEVIQRVKNLRQRKPK